MNTFSPPHGAGSTRGFTTIDPERQGVLPTAARFGMALAMKPTADLPRGSRPAPARPMRAAEAQAPR